MGRKFHIGCSGYYYPSWKGKFYPENLQAKQWLEYYSSKLNTVELNSSFYRVPKISDLKKYSGITPAYFTFSAKMSKYITHILKLKNSRQLIDDFQNLLREGLGDKLSYFLFQLPPSFQFSSENLETIISNIPHEINNVIEFRHQSWWNNDVKNEITNAGITFCNVDFPGLATPFINTTTNFYLRLHGNPELFKSCYTRAQLSDFYEKIPANCTKCTVYFNNTTYEAAYTNAFQLIEIINSHT